MENNNFRIDDAGYAWIGDQLVIGATNYEYRDFTDIGLDIKWLRCGFRVTLDNGWQVSCQFGSTNYCDNYDNNYKDDPKPISKTTEMAAWNKDHIWLDWSTGTWCDPAKQTTDVIGYVTVEEALFYIQVISELPEESPPGLKEATEQANKTMHQNLGLGIDDDNKREDI